jgi:site-specific DNA-methyltransferase (adenine-specific)
VETGTASEVIRLSGLFVKGRLIVGDILEGLARLPDSCIAAIVTDPPYELGFMGKGWDKAGVSFQVETWEACLRVLKPGGHMVVFGGTRTHHRMWCAIEDAGFEVREMLLWLYGQGFPKSLDVSKAIDKEAGAKRKVIGVSPNDRPHSQVRGGRAFDKALDSGQEHAVLSITAPATDAAKRREGWGTALKPACEPILLARKPLAESNVAANVLKWGTGGLNIDGCRIPGMPPTTTQGKSSHIYGGGHGFAPEGQQVSQPSELGRWPANVLLDEEAAGMLDEQSGDRPGMPRTTKRRGDAPKGYGIGVAPDDASMSPGYGDSGGASRFFYCPKAPKAERGKGNKHPTVKPLALMQWLVRLVTPPNGVVLDPFCGSGSTLIAAVREGHSFVGIDIDREYCAIAEQRLLGESLSGDGHEGGDDT